MAISQRRQAVLEAWDLLERYGEFNRDTRMVNGYPTGHAGEKEEVMDDDTWAFVKQFMDWLRGHHWQVYYTVQLYFVGDKKQVTREDDGHVFVYYDRKTPYEIGRLWQRSDKWANDMIYLGVGMLESLLHVSAVERNSVFEIVS